jgi:hypothetical protein
MYCNIWQDLRLLGELHAALQVSIIKDTEDITQTSSDVLGVGQSEYVDSGGGSQIGDKVCVRACVRVCVCAYLIGFCKGLIKKMHILVNENG